MTVNHSLFRLRSDTTIVGYLKLYANGKSEFSKDMFWWHGDRIQYDEKDAFFLANTIEIIGRYSIMMSSPFEKEPPQKKKPIAY